jgi:perosamine synthetase
MNPEPQGTINGGWMPTVVFEYGSGLTKEGVLSAFTALNIDARVFFWPLSTLNIFNTQPVNNSVAYDIPNRAVNLPSYHDMTDDEQKLVTSVILETFKNQGLRPKASRRKNS